MREHESRRTSPLYGAAARTKMLLRVRQGGTVGLALTVVLAVLSAPAVASESNSPAARPSVLAKKCRVVVKRVHGKRRHVHLCRKAKAKRPIPPPSPTSIAGAKIAATISIAHTPAQLVFGEGAVWVRDVDGTLARVDPTTNALVGVFAATPPVVGSPGWITAGDGAVWLPNYNANTITRFDPGTNKPVATIPVGLAPTGVATTAAAIWVVNHHGLSVSRIDPASNSVVATIPVGDQTIPPQGGPQVIVSTGDAVWVAATEANGSALERIDSVTNTVTRKIPLDGVCGLEFGVESSAIWTSAKNCTAVTRVDTSAGAVGTAYASPYSTANIKVGGGSVWIAAPNDPFVPTPGIARLDAATGKLVGSSPLPTAGGLDLGAGSVWIDTTDQKLLRLQP